MLSCRYNLQKYVGTGTVQSTAGVSVWQSTTDRTYGVQSGVASYCIALQCTQQSRKNKNIKCKADHTLTGMPATTTGVTGMPVDSGLQTCLSVYDRPKPNVVCH